MQKYFNNVQTKGGSAVAGARVTIRTDSGSLATIYSDNGVTVASNPIYTNTFGYFEFYAADGRYSIEIAGPGIGTQTISDVLLEDPADGSAALAASGGSALVGFIQAGSGAVARTVQDKARELPHSAGDFGAVANGVVDDSGAIGLVFGADSGTLSVTAGTYNLFSNVMPESRDLNLCIDTKAVFTGTGKLDLDNILSFQNDPIFAHDVARKTYTTDWDGFQNLFLHARHAKNTTTSSPVVAYYGTGEAASAGGRAFGANFTGFVTADGGRATGIEVDVGFRNGATSGHLYGVTIVSAGAAAADVAAQIQCNDSTAQFGNGINVNFNASPGSGAVTGAVFRIGSNGGAAASCQRFLYATSEMSATAAEIDFPSFRVDATQANTVNYVAVRGAASGSSPRISATSLTDLNVNLDLRSQGTGAVLMTTNGVENFRAKANAGVDSLQAGAGTGLAELSARGASTSVDVAVIGKGTGGVRLRDGGNADRVRVNTTGLGFNGSVPISKPSITGSRGSNAALAALLTQLAAYGLITDGTTA